MGNKGVKRRRRNALAANSSNLHKAQFGKASKFAALPDAPKSADFAQPVSKSTLKVQRLMAAMASKPSQSLSTAAAQAEGPVQRANDGVEYSDLPAANDSTAGYQQPANSSAQSASAKLSKTKLKRKNHLADKKAERRKQVHEKKRQKNPEDARKDNSESNAFKLEVVPFGEVADAPPAVSLKRKNHVDGKACRHSVALQKHLEAGQARLMQGTKDLADARAAAMGAYRAGRRKQTDEGEKNANMESLKALVNSQSPKVQTAV